MALSNIGAVFVARADATWKRGRLAAVVAAGRLAFGTVVVTGLLAALQLWIYPRTVPFYAWGGVSRDDRLSFFRPTSMGDALAHASEVGAHLVLFNLAAPRLEVRGRGHRVPDRGFSQCVVGRVSPDGPGPRHDLGCDAALAALGLVSSRGAWTPPVRAVGLWLAMNAALHSVFGVSLFLYSCQWTFAVVVLAAIGTAAWAQELPTGGAWFRPASASW